MSKNTLNRWDHCSENQWYHPLGQNESGDPRDVFITREFGADNVKVYWVDVRDAGVPIITPGYSTTLELAMEQGEALAERHAPQKEKRKQDDTLLLDLSAVAAPDPKAVIASQQLSEKERQVVLQMFQHIPRIKRCEFPSGNKPFCVTPNSPDSFYVGPGPIKSLVRKNILDVITPDQEWALKPIGFKIGYVLSIDSAIRKLRYAETYANVSRDT